MPGEPVRQRIVVPFNGHVIGEGFNSDTVERVGTGLTVPTVGDDPIAPGQTAVFKFQMLTSQASLEKALNIGAEVEARYALFSGGAKFSFAENSAVNTTSTYIVASCMVTNALRFGSGFTPTESAARLIAAGDLDGFKTAFGDRFTQALHTGGEFHALVRVTSSNVEHQRKISASLHAELNGLIAAASFKGSFEHAQSDSSSHTEVDIQVHQTGGVGDQVQIPGTEANRIREHMNRFAAAAHANAAAYEAELLTYDTLALPFPPLEELEEKRRVLEGCLVRRQAYWSAISDLTFAQSEDAQLIFENLPAPEELVALQNAFRKVLNDLMAHARKVSRGTIPPAFFVAEEEPPLPRFKRRNASSFGTWWARAKSNDPTLLRDESLLISDIARSARHMLTVPVEEASPATMERAADMIKDLALNTGIDHLETPRLRSLEILPRMLDAPLRDISGIGTELEDLAGIEGFSRLERLEFFDGRLRDLRAVTSVAGVRELNLGKNAIADLEPLRALTSLRELDLGQNEIEDLTPLAALTNLEVLSLASNRVNSLEPLRELPALRVLALNPRHNADMTDNPISDARALAESPRLASPLTSKDELRLKAFGAEGQVTRTGVATRIGDSNRFQFVSDAGGEPEEIQVQGLFEWTDFNVFPAPVVATAVRFANAEVGIACTRPEDRSTSLPTAEMISLFPDQIPLGRSFSVLPFRSTVFDRMPPHLFLEVEPG
jgi:hypothetical protein